MKPLLALLLLSALIGLTRRLYRLQRGSCGGYERAQTKRLGLEPGKKARIGLHACRGLAALSGLILAACTVYEEPLCGRAHPGGGVTVRVAELADDGGSE